MKLYMGMVSASKKIKTSPLAAFAPAFLPAPTVLLSITTTLSAYFLAIFTVLSLLLESETIISNFLLKSWFFRDLRVLSIYFSSFKVGIITEINGFIIKQ